MRKTKAKALSSTRILEEHIFHTLHFELKNKNLCMSKYFKSLKNINYSFKQKLKQYITTRNKHKKRIDEQYTYILEKKNQCIEK